MSFFLGVEGVRSIVGIYHYMNVFFVALPTAYFFFEISHHRKNPSGSVFHNPFRSEKWAGRSWLHPEVSMPDPTGAQLAVFRQVLRGLMDRSLKVEADLTSMDMGKGLKPAVLQSVTNGDLEENDKRLPCRW